jgi:hypothetical protein
VILDRNGGDARDAISWFFKDWRLRMKTLLTVFSLFLFTATSYTQSTWSTPAPINPSTFQTAPSIAVGPQREIAIACTENGVSVYLSTDNGGSFNRTATLAPSILPGTRYLLHPQKEIKFDPDGNIFVLWRWTWTDEFGFPILDYLTLSKSTDGGSIFSTFWQTQQGFMYHETYPLLITNDRTIHVAWDSSGSWGVFAVPIYTKFLNGSLSSRVDVALPRPMDTSFTADYYSLLVSGDTVHFASDHVNSYKLYYSRSTNRGETFVGMVQVDTVVEAFPRLATSASGRVVVLSGVEGSPPRARYLVDSSLEFSPPFGLGNYGLGSPFTMILHSHLQRNLLVFRGGVYYEFEDLQSSPIDSTLFPNITQVGFAVDSMGGKYFVGEHVSESRVYFAKKDVVSSAKEQWFIPGRSKLGQNYPNPFNPTTTIEYTVGNGSEDSGAKQVTLTVYDILGREIAVLVNEKQGPGIYKARLEARQFGSGVYLYRLQVGKNFVAVKKLLVIR